MAPLVPTHRPTSLTERSREAQCTCTSASYDIVDTFAHVADEAGITVVQLAIAWVINHPDDNSYCAETLKASNRRR